MVLHDFERPLSASSPNSASVRTTRSTFSRNAFVVRRASRTVSVVKVLRKPLRFFSISLEQTSIDRERQGGNLPDENVVFHFECTSDGLRLQLGVDFDRLLGENRVFVRRERYLKSSCMYIVASERKTRRAGGAPHTLCQSDMDEKVEELKSRHDQLKSLIRLSSLAKNERMGIKKIR